MKQIFTFLAAVLVTASTFAQVGIGTTTPEESAVLDIYSASKALLVTRVANTAAITTPIKGMIVYSNAENKFKIYQTVSGTDMWVDMFV
jgi:hypothetical protein